MFYLYYYYDSEFLVVEFKDIEKTWHFFFLLIFSTAVTLFWPFSYLNLFDCSGTVVELLLINKPNTFVLNFILFICSALNLFAEEWIVETNTFVVCLHITSTFPKDALFISDGSVKLHEEYTKLFSIFTAIHVQFVYVLVWKCQAFPSWHSSLTFISKSSQTLLTINNSNKNNTSSCKNKYLLYTTSKSNNYTDCSFIVIIVYPAYKFVQ